MSKKATSSIRFCIFLSAALALMGTIFYFSSQISTVSDESSGSVIGLLELFLGSDFINSHIDILVFLVRKGAHFSEYLLLGLFLTLALREKLSPGLKVPGIGLLVCVGYAAFDEIHQAFVPGRSCELRDVCVDASGAFLGVLFVYLFDRAERKRMKAKEGGNASPDPGPEAVGKEGRR